MIRSSAFDYINALDTAADAAWVRNEVISNNIANINTDIKVRIVFTVLFLILPPSLCLNYIVGEHQNEYTINTIRIIITILAV